MLLRQSPGFMLPTVAQVREDNFRACVSRMKKKKYSKAVGDTTMLHAGLAAEQREKTVRPCVRFAQLGGEKVSRWHIENIISKNMSYAGSSVSEMSDGWLPVLIKKF